MYASATGFVGHGFNCFAVQSTRDAYSRLECKWLWASTLLTRSLAVASPGFVARRGKDRHYVMGHSWRTSEPGAAAVRRLIVLWLMQYWSKELWHLHQLISQTTQYLDSWLSELLQSELKIKLLEVEERHVPQCLIAGNATDHLL